VQQALNLIIREQADLFPALPEAAHGSLLRVTLEENIPLAQWWPRKNVTSAPTTVSTPCMAR
jgi:hypothetical protein